MASLRKSRAKARVELMEDARSDSPQGSVSQSGNPGRRIRLDEPSSSNKDDKNPGWDAADDRVWDSGLSLDDVDASAARRDDDAASTATTGSSYKISELDAFWPEYYDEREAMPCGLCQKPVYFAERAWSMGFAYHRECLRCGYCYAQLAPGSHVVKMDVPYCGFTCYNKLYASDGYRYTFYESRK